MNSVRAHPSVALVADAIARIEECRDALDRLAAKGMEMLERIVAGEKVEIAGRKPFSDPARAFAVISRAVRLCLSLASRLDEAVIALLRGGPVPDLAILKPEAPNKQATRRERITRALNAVIEAEVVDVEVADRMRTEVHERLTEREHYDAYLHLPWRVVVERICADLGLDPEWDLHAPGQTPPPAHPGGCRDTDESSGLVALKPYAHHPPPGRGPTDHDP